MFIAVATILLLAIVCSICIKVAQSYKPKEIELSKKNTDVLVLERLNTVKDINDEKYAAKTREELRKAMAEGMAKEQSLSESESDLEEKPEPVKPVETA